jgi:hypothetical protein
MPQMVSARREFAIPTSAPSLLEANSRPRTMWRYASPALLAGLLDDPRSVGQQVLRRSDCH